MTKVHQIMHQICTDAANKSFFFSRKSKYKMSQYVWTKSVSNRAFVVAWNRRSSAWHHRAVKNCLQCGTCTICGCFLLIKHPGLLIKFNYDWWILVCVSMRFKHVMLVEGLTRSSVGEDVGRVCQVVIVDFGG